MRSDVLTGPTAPPTDETRLSQGQGSSHETMKPKRPSVEAALPAEGSNTFCLSLEMESALARVSGSPVKKKTKPRAPKDVFETITAGLCPSG